MMLECISIQKVFEPRPPRDPLRVISTIFKEFLYQGQKSPELVCQASSHNFLSVIFGILRKFCIDIGVQKIFIEKKFVEKNSKRLSIFLVENFWSENFRPNFGIFDILEQNRDFRDFENFEILKILKVRKNFEKISFLILPRPNK